MTMNAKKSKFLCFVLRHRPDAAGLTLDENGWVDVDLLIKGVNSAKGAGYLTHDVLMGIVSTDDKGRYGLRTKGHKTQIRTVHGHSIDVSTGVIASPPPFLFHGTATRFLRSIYEQGIVRGSRQHVHLTETVDEGMNVGSRHGTPVVLRIVTGDMVAEGTVFHRSDSGIWLTSHVPAKHIESEIYDFTSHPAMTGTGTKVEFLPE